MTVKQNVAAYLIHEKYGHGFFYTQTLLGQQLALLIHHGFLINVDVADADDCKRVSRLIRDSTTIVDEGFAAWLELTFLARLDREARQAAYPRRTLLIDEASGLYAGRSKSEFFAHYPPRFDSPYREGFEYLDFIGQRFDLHCVVRLFLLATAIDMGIRGDGSDGVQFTTEPAAVRDKLLDPTSGWQSHLRLRRIAEILFESLKKAQLDFRENHCPIDCGKSGCPLETYVRDRLDRRKS